MTVLRVLPSLALFVLLAAVLAVGVSVAVETTAGLVEALGGV